MSRKNHKRQSEMLPVLHPDAAGVDIGAEEVFVAVSSDRDSDPVKKFSTFTRDLLELAEWLNGAVSAQCRWSRPACIGFRFTRF
jgi:transposase